MQKTRIAQALLVVLAGVALIGCGDKAKTSSDGSGVGSAISETASATASETAADSASATDVATSDALTGDTQAGSSEVPNGSVQSGGTEVTVSATLAADSKTCVSLGRVRDANDKASALVAKLTSGLQGGTQQSAEEIGTIFETFVGEFKKESETMLPELNSAYDDLASEQPQFSDDLANIKVVTVGILDALGKMKATDMERFQEILTTAVAPDKMTAAGQSSLKIDDFSKASCGIPFANT